MRGVSVVDFIEGKKNGGGKNGTGKEPDRIVITSEDGHRQTLTVKECVGVLRSLKKLGWFEKAEQEEPLFNGAVAKV